MADTMERTALIEAFDKVLKDHLKATPLGKKTAEEYHLLVVHMRQMADTLEGRVKRFQ